MGGPPKPSPCDVKGGPGPPLCNNEGGSTTSPSKSECKLDEKEMKCLVHNCNFFWTNVSSKSWKKNKKTGLFGWSCKKVKKAVCRGRNQGRTGPGIYTSIDSSVQTGVGKILPNDQGIICDNGEISVSSLSVGVNGRYDTR